MMCDENIRSNVVQIRFIWTKEEEEEKNKEYKHGPIVIFQRVITFGRCLQFPVDRT